jgi:hypothetical protein
MYDTHSSRAETIAEFGDAVQAVLKEKRHGPEPPGVLSAT